MRIEEIKRIAGLKAVGWHRLDFVVMCINNIDKMIAVIEAAMALKGDLDAHDESPTHFCSYFNLSEALEDLEKE